MLSSSKAQRAIERVEGVPEKWWWVCDGWMADEWVIDSGWVMRVSQYQTSLGDLPDINQG